MIYHEGQRAYIVPDESRDKYFEMIDKLGYINNIEQVIDASNDPIIIIDKSLITEIQFNYINITMQVIIGAKILKLDQNT